jgi:O-antigen/teichoic acid export membrane protein
MEKNTPSFQRRDRTPSLKAIFVNMGWLLGGRGVAAVLSLLYIAVITRTLGLVGFGQFSLVVGTGQTIAALVGFQTWQVIVRYGMAHLHEQRPLALVRLVKTCLLLDVTAAMIGSLLALAAILLLSGHFGWSAELRSYGLLFCVATLLGARSTSVGVLRLYDRFGVAAVADTALPICRLVGAATVWAVSPRVESFLLAWVVADLLSSLAFWGFALGILRHLPWRAGRFSWHEVRIENPEILRLVLVTNASQTFDLTGKQVAVLLVGFFASTAAAGGFRLAHQLGQAMAKIGQLLARALFPELMRARTAAGTDDFARLLKRSTRTAALFGGAVLMLLLVAARPLLSAIAGPAFEHTYPLLILLGAAAVVDLIGVAFEPALIASGHAGQAFRIRLFTIGAPLAMLIGSLTEFTLMAIAVRRALGARGPHVRKADAALIEGVEEDVDTL